MATTSAESKNPAKAFEDLTPDQKERALTMFDPLRPHTDYLYEIDGAGEVRCRRYNRPAKPADSTNSSDPFPPRIERR